MERGENMILIVELDPILEKIYCVNRLYSNTETIAESVENRLGGDGIISARILNNLNLNVFTMGFLGGLNGQYIFDQLKLYGIYNDFVSIKDESKSSISLFENKRLFSTIIEPGPRITREELVWLYEVYNKVIDNHSIICSMGNIPIGVPDEIYYDLIDLANRRKKKFILDTTGRALTRGIEAIPFMVKVDKHDLENMSRLKLDFETEIIRVGRSVLEKGIEIVVIDLDKDGTIVLTRDRGYRLELPDGDLNDINKDRGYLVSGYAFGIERQYDFETTMRLAQAMRIVYGLEEDVDKIDMGDIKGIMSRIEISSIYY